MRSELLVPLSVGVAFVVLIALAIRHRRQQLRLFEDGMRERDIPVTVESFTGVPTAHFEEGDLRATLRPDSTGGKHPIPLWRVELSGVELGRSTTLTLARAGVFTPLARAVGLGGVRSGAEAFDSLVTVTGSDRDVVGALLRGPAQRHAITSFLEQRPEVFSCELDAEGLLVVRVRRTRMDIPEALAQVVRVRDLAVGLGEPVLRAARRR